MLPENLFVPDLMVTLLNQIPNPPYSALNPFDTTLNSPTCSSEGPFSARDPREIAWLALPPSTNTSVSPTFAPFARGLKVVPPVNPGRFCRNPVISLLLPPTITGSSSTSFCDNSVVLVIVEESSADALTATVSVTPAGLSTRSTRIWTPDRRLIASAVAGPKPSFVTSTRYSPRGRLGAVKNPTSLVVIEVTVLVARWRISPLAPGMTAPLGSFTVP